MPTKLTLVPTPLATTVKEPIKLLIKSREV